PEYLMLDEPSLGLAPVIVEQIFDKFVILKNQGLGLLIVEQNATLALEVSDYAYVLETGVLTLHASGKALLNDPRVKEAYLS
ncbi:MAG: ABC transporter ATP-binding protein, partial [Pseudobdellovibrio sp.]